MGKNFANKKPIDLRPVGDFYETPSCMVKELLEAKDGDDRIFNILKPATILDPCCGKYAIGNILKGNGYNVEEKDIMYGQDFLKEDYSGKHYPAVVMNPPFKLFDKFVKKAITVSDKVYCIGKLTFFGAHERNISGFWDHLEWVLAFDRQIAFDTKEDENGKVQCGMLVSGWFIWNMNYNGYPKIKMIDMQKYIRKSK